MSGAFIAAQAELWIGTPFRWQGRVRGQGCDCKGLIAGIFAELGLPEAESVEALAGDYGKRVPTMRLRAGLARLFDQVEERQPGDLLLVKLGGAAQHLAIAAPTKGRSRRTIEALCIPPFRVRPFLRRDSEIDSTWRRRAPEGLPCL